MISTRFLLRCIATLSALSLCDAAVNYYVAMLWPTGSMADYASVYEGHTLVDDVAYGEDFEAGRLPQFPASRFPRPQQIFPLTINIETGFPFQVEQTFPTYGASVGPLRELLGEWSADVFWGEFEGADFDPDSTMYSWIRAMDRKFRVVGDGEWCRGGVHIPVPTSVEYVGRGDDTPRYQIDPVQLEGVNATFALRLNYFDMDRGFNHPNYSDPIHVWTTTFSVEFSSTLRSFQRRCNAGDNGADTRAEALAIAGITPTGVQPSATTTTGTTTTSTYTGVVWSPHPRPDEAQQAQQVNAKHVGAGVGAGFGLIIILYVFFKCASQRQKIGSPTHDSLPSSEMSQSGPTSERRERVGESAPVHQSGTPESGRERPVAPESGLLAEYRAAAEANDPTRTSGTAVRTNTDEMQQPPPIYEPPPRYEDISAGPPRRT